MKTVAYQKTCVSVCLASKADDAKLPPFTVSKWAKQETAALSKWINNCFIASFPNASLNIEITHRWVNKDAGEFSLCHLYLVWSLYAKILMFQFFSVGSLNIYILQMLGGFYIIGIFNEKGSKLLHEKNTTSS